MSEQRTRRCCRASGWKKRHPAGKKDLRLWWPDLNGSSSATLYRRARARTATACCGSTLPRASRLRSARCSRALFAARSAGDARGDRPSAGFSGDVAALRRHCSRQRIESSFLLAVPWLLDELWCTTQIVRG